MKYLKITITIALSFLIIYFIFAQFFRSEYSDFRIEVTPKTLPADGRSTTKISVILLDEKGEGFSSAGIEVCAYSQNPEIGKILGKNCKKTEKGKAEFLLQSTLMAGQCSLSVSDGNGKEKSLKILTTPVYSDSDKDGFPDVVELTSEKDRLNFREAFVKIAEAQLDSFSDFWNEQERDCAGLLRFAYREALKKHDPDWIAQIGISREIKLPEVEKYNYPNVPILGTKIFRTNSKSFQVEDLQDTTFSVFAKGQYLKEFNTRPIGKETKNLQKGDLLFFLHYDDPEMPFHAMIYIGDDDGFIEEGNDNWLIYHTGPLDDSKGKMKKIRISTLNQHPDESWHTIENNPYFLGFYRWKILD